MQAALDYLAPRANAALTRSEALLAGKTAKVPHRALKRTYQPGNLFDVARGFARRVPLTRLAEMDGEVRPYLAALMVAAMYKVG